MTELKVLSVTSEVFPLIKTGGLADVTGALPAALAPHDIAMRTLVPGYPAVMQGIAKSKGKVLHRWADLFGGPAELVAGKVGALNLLALDAKHLFDRPGNPYLDASGVNWPDNALRFGALSYAAAEIGHGIVKDFTPDVVHAHDWQAGLVPAFLRFGANGGKRKLPATVLTIHNIAYQGTFPAALLTELKLPNRAFTMEGVEYYGQIGFLKGGLSLADHITTVSPTYAVEIQGSELGMGLDGLLRHRADVVTGILNGIDLETWDPSSDANLAARYDTGKLELRAKNKAAIRKRFDLSTEDAGPLVTLVSRLTWQKGIDLVGGVLPRLIAGGGQIALLGSGDPALQTELAAAARRYPGKVGLVLGYDEALSHLLQGGSDAILVPSRFEPCGLTQLYGLRYGTVPVVARTGGLADTVIDANDVALAAGVATGFQFAPVTTDALGTALGRMLKCFRDRETWREIQVRGMATDVSWRRPAKQYAELYRTLVASRNTVGAR